MSKQIEALKLALEALESLFNGKVDEHRAKRCSDAITAIRSALAEQPAQQEPLTDHDDRRKMIADARAALKSVTEQLRHGDSLGASLALHPVEKVLDSLSVAQQPAQQELVAIVEAVVPHLESIVVKHILDAPFPKVGDFFYTAPQPAQQEPSVPAAAFDRLSALNESNAARIIELQDRIDAMMPPKAEPTCRPMTDWIAVSDNLPTEADGEVLVRMRDGRCEIAWATYWHGASNAFSQWTFRDPDEDEAPTHWMRIPTIEAAHGIKENT